MPYQWHDFMHLHHPMYHHMSNAYAVASMGLAGGMPLPNAPGCGPSRNDSADEKRSKRRRILFDPYKIHIMEEHFKESPHITPSMRQTIAQQAGLTQTQVKIWFQNRRYKEKKKEADRKFMEKGIFKSSASSQHAPAGTATPRNESSSSNSYADALERSPFEDNKPTKAEGPSEHGATMRKPKLEDTRPTATDEMAVVTPQAVTPNETLPEDLRMNPTFGAQHYSAHMYSNVPMNWNRSTGADAQAYYHTNTTPYF
ncbi:CRE-CEH-27 protein [Aphelenchoides avenae]|nr:CRE-CEH-27 protein [Aphelenchus avenae]